MGFCLRLDNVQQRVDTVETWFEGDVDRFEVGAVLLHLSSRLDKASFQGGEDGLGEARDESIQPCPLND